MADFRQPFLFYPRPRQVAVRSRGP
jgi:hypothetical protein